MILQRIEGERLSRVLPLWGGYTVVILGGGPSLTAEQLELVRAARAEDVIRAIAINDAYLVAPWADVSYAADSKWFTWHGAGIAKPKLGLAAAEVRGRWADFRGQKCGIESAGNYIPDDVHVLRVSGLTGALSRDPGAISTGRQDGYHGHSGFQAVNIAVLAGAKNILLLGFDGGLSSDGRSHFHGDHPIPTPADVWPYILRSFSCVENELTAMGVHIVNCSPGSAIGSFEKMPLADALVDLRIAA